MKTNEFHSLVELCDKTQEEKKPALVYLTMEGCDLCDLFEMKVLAQPNILEYINDHFIFYEVDVKQNLEFNKLGHIYSFPVFVLIDGTELELIFTPQRNADVLLMSLKNYKTQPLEYNILNITKLDGDARNISDAIRMTLNALYHIADSLYRVIASEISSFDELVHRNELPLVLSKHYDLDMNQKVEMTFEDTDYDFGNIQKNHPVFHKFVFKNTSNSPLLIFNIISSCGCTVASHPDYPILPDHCDTITVSFDSKKPGFFNKPVFVLSNAQKKQTRLSIKGNVLE